MAKLDESFPGRTALEEAGEFDIDAVRKRVLESTLTEIPGIGEATAAKIAEALAQIDSEPLPEKISDTTDEADSLKSADPMSKPETPLPSKIAGLTTAAEKVAHCGSIFVDDPTGQYASRDAVPLRDSDGRIKVLPISHISPRQGMRVRDGEDEYTVREPLELNAAPEDWVKVFSPNTGLAFIR